MTVDVILRADAAIRFMQISDVPYKVVRGFQKLKNLISEEATIAHNRQVEILEKMGGEVQDQAIVFPNVEKRLAYEREMDELLKSEVDLEFEPLNLTRYVDEIKFRDVNADVDALSAFILFEDE